MYKYLYSKNIIHYTSWCFDDCYCALSFMSDQCCCSSTWLPNTLFKPFSYMCYSSGSLALPSVMYDSAAICVSDCIESSGGGSGARLARKALIL